MHTLLTPVCLALEALASSILSGWGGDQTFIEAWGWNCYPMTRHDLASIPQRLATRIRETSPTEIGPIDPQVLQDIPRRLQLLQSQTVPQIFGGNNMVSVTLVVQSVDLISELLEPIIGWQVINDPKSLPPALARRIRSYTALLNQMDSDMGSLEGKIQRIKEAHDAAEALPADMEMLSEASERVKKISDSASDLLRSINRQAEDANSALTEIADSQLEAMALVSQCDEAYRITTTVGLAGAFDQRAKGLSQSMWVWVIVLLGALTIGAWIGTGRVELLSKAIAEQDPHWGAIALHIALSVLSIGGPLWVAWLATKQIGQRFRLAEDYAFKASVAKAYEGYRKEAARIDEVFEARLFSSALARLEEAPLRLVEGTAHGSPWHEFMSSPAFQRAIETVPNFKDSLTDMFKQGADAIKGIAKTDRTKDSIKPSDPQTE